MTTSTSAPTLERVVRLVTDRTGLQIPPSRRPEAEAGIRRAMARAGIQEVHRYLDLAEVDDQLLDDLISELTVRETYFFRDPAHFDFACNEVIPDVLSRRGREHALRAWSAGCASGEEAYSLAIVLEERGLSANVLATDVARVALQKARDATYGRWSLRDIGDARLTRWFQRIGDRWQLAPRIRRRVSFDYHNLARHAYPSTPAGIWGMDLILCRNVLIYFDRPGVEHVARGLHGSLAEGGWLITGPSDPSLDGFESLRAVATAEGIFYRRSEARPRASTPPPMVTGAPETGPATPSPVVPAPRRDLAQEAREAFARGDYERVRALTRDEADDASSILYVRATANCRGDEEAAHEARRRADRSPLCLELHFLEAALRLNSGRTEAAVRAIRKLLYLDPSTVIAHFFLGSTLRREGKLDEARRAYRNARDLARALPREALLPLSDGERAGALADKAEAALSLIDARGGSS